MITDQVTLVKSSFASIGPAEDAVATQFYARLFALDPMSAELHGASIRRTTRATRHSDWQTHAITTYHQAQGQATTRMQADLTARIHRLTGRMLATESIFVERDACLATVVVDRITTSAL